MSETTWKVVRILDNFNVVVNAGRDEVNIGDELEIIEAGKTFIDPDTGEDLGRLEKVKAIVVVIQREEKFCVAESPTEYVRAGEKVQSLLGLSGTANISQIFGELYKDVKRIQAPLNVDPQDPTPDWRELKDPVIRVRDPVRMRRKKATS